MPLKEGIKGVDLEMEKGSEIRIMIGEKGKPEAFVFNTSGFLDLLSAMDEGLVDRLSSEDYHSSQANFAGWLIDQIEERLPVSKAAVESLKEALQESREKGWIQFDSIKNELALN